MNCVAHINRKDGLGWVSYRTLAYTQITLEDVIKKISEHIQGDSTDYTVTISTPERQYCYTGEVIEKLVKVW